MEEVHKTSSLRLKNVLILLGLWGIFGLMVSAFAITPSQYHDYLSVFFVVCFALPLAFIVFRNRKPIVRFIAHVPKVSVAIGSELLKLSASLVGWVIGLSILAAIIWAFFSYPLPVIAVLLLLILLALMNK